MCGVLFWCVCAVNVGMCMCVSRCSCVVFLSVCCICTCMYGYVCLSVMCVYRGMVIKMGACIVQCNKLPAVDSLTVSKCFPSYPPSLTVSVMIVEPGSWPKPASGAL